MLPVSAPVEEQMKPVICEDQENVQSEGRILGKRKRKTERELKILRSELRKNVMWTRESIKQMRKLYESDFSMSEQQIYKWWWDQTRKRTKKNHCKSGGPRSNDEAPSHDQVLDEDGDLLISFQDEFGGYSSRLRLNSNGTAGKAQKVGDDADKDNVDLNLCALLGIDVDAIAYRLAIGLDEEDAEVVEDAAGPDTDIQKRNTAASTNSSPEKSVLSLRSSNDIEVALSSSLINPKDAQDDTILDNFAQNKMMIDELINNVEYKARRKSSFGSDKHRVNEVANLPNEMAEATTRTVSYST